MYWNHVFYLIYFLVVLSQYLQVVAVCYAMTDNLVTVNQFVRLAALCFRPARK